MLAKQNNICYYYHIISYLGILKTVSISKGNLSMEEMSIKKTSIHIYAHLWEGVEALADQEPWNIKSIMAAATLHFLMLSEDEQWQAFRNLSNFKKGLITLPSLKKVK
jgi:hypothetical protein